MIQDEPAGFIAAARRALGGGTAERWAVKGGSAMSCAVGSGKAEKYVLGQMSDRERDQYEEHFFDCPDCADEVKAVSTFLEDVETIVRDDMPAKADDPQRQKADTPSWWLGLKAAFWPMPLGAAATLTLLMGGPAVYLASVTVPRLERARAEAESLQAAPWHFLSVSRSESPVVSVSGSQRMVGLRLSKSGSRAFPFYLCEVRDASGRVVISNVVAAPPRGGELQILLPAAKLQPGAHVIAVAGLEAASSRPSPADFTVYPFTFERE